jgi:hypothetical protein
MTLAPYTDSELWDACVAAMRDRSGALDLCDVAQAAGMSEEAIVAALIRETGVRRRTVTFRYPPLPRAAITAIG